MTADREFLYMHEVKSMRCFVTDDGRFGMHLTKTNDETLDIVFDQQAHPDLDKLRKLLNTHLPPKE